MMVGGELFYLHILVVLDRLLPPNHISSGEEYESRDNRKNSVEALG